MNTKQKLHQLHMNEWTTHFSDQKASELTVKEWCNQNNLSIHTYNYWKHALKEELAVSFSQTLFQSLSLNRLHLLLQSYLMIRL